MEDTIGRMEDSLSRNEVKSFRKKQILANMTPEKKAIFSPHKSSRLNQSRSKENWINRSREMR